MCQSLSDRGAEMVNETKMLQAPLEVKVKIFYTSCTQYVSTLTDQVTLLIILYTPGSFPSVTLLETSSGRHQDHPANQYTRVNSGQNTKFIQRGDIQAFRYRPGHKRLAGAISNSVPRNSQGTVYVTDAPIYRKCSVGICTVFWTELCSSKFSVEALMYIQRQALEGGN